MEKHEDDIRVQKERTLTAAWMISLWAPLGTIVAFYFGRSTILLADLLRRSSELLMLFISWLVYRKVMKGPTKTFNYGYGKLESLASLAIACVMVISFGIVANTAFQQFRNPVESGWILPGLLVALGGGLVNGWFWRRNRKLACVEPSPIILSQLHLYRVKTLIDIGVFLTLSLSKLLERYSWSVFIDPVGSMFVACFLLFSAYQVLLFSVLDLADCALSPSVLLSINQMLELHADKYKRLWGFRSRSSGSTAYIEILAEFDGDRNMCDVHSDIEHICSSVQEQIPNACVSVVLVSKQTWS